MPPVGRSARGSSARTSLACSCGPATSRPRSGVQRESGRIGVEPETGAAHACTKLRSGATSRTRAGSNAPPPVRAPSSRWPRGERARGHRARQCPTPRRAEVRGECVGPAQGEAGRLAVAAPLRLPALRREPRRLPVPTVRSRTSPHRSRARCPPGLRAVVQPRAEPDPVARVAERAQRGENATPREIQGHARPTEHLAILPPAAARGRPS